jgi:hypothetical protein
VKPPKLIASLFFLIISASVFCQKGLQKGWVVNNSGDTLIGSIESNEWNRNPTKITFIGNKERKFEVNDLSAFAMVNENIVYKRYTVTKHLAPINENVDVTTGESKTDTEIVWLKILVTGRTSLASYVNNDRRYFYYIIGDSATELIYSKGIKNYSDEKYKGDPIYGLSSVTENFEYKKQLQQLAANETRTSDVFDDAKNTDYTEYSLVNIFNKLNNFKNTIGAKGDNHLFIGIGLTAFSNKITGNAGAIGSTSKIDNPVSPLFKIGYQIKSSKPNAKISYIQEVGLMRYNTLGTRSSATSNGLTYDIRNTFLQVSLLIKYTVNPLQKAKISVSAGLAGFFTLSHNNSTTDLNSGGSVTVYSNTPEFKKLVGCPAGAVTVDYLKFNFFANYSYINNITSYVNAAYRLNIFSVGFMRRLL